MGERTSHGTRLAGRTWHDPSVETPNEDQRPDGWSEVAA